jgi:hypothetical protein
VGNFQVCDAISVVNGQAAYTLQVGGVNVAPESANHMLVSLNGILQKPGSSFTISGSTMTFASNLATGDVIDFVQILGNVLDLGTPSDDTVTAAKLNNDIISGQTALTSSPDDTDEFLISDAGTLKRIDYSLVKSDPTHVLLSTTTISSATTNIDITSNIDSTYLNYMISITNLHPASDAVLKTRFFTGTGGSQAVDTGNNYRYGHLSITNSGSTLTSYATGDSSQLASADLGAANNESFNANLFLRNPSNTTFDTLLHGQFSYADSSDRAHTGIFNLKYQETTAITGVRFFMSSGDIDSAIIKLYGIN